MLRQTHGLTVCANRLSSLNLGLQQHPDVLLTGGGIVLLPTIDTEPLLYLLGLSIYDPHAGTRLADHASTLRNPMTMTALVNHVPRLCMPSKLPSHIQDLQDVFSVSCEIHPGTLQPFAAPRRRSAALALQSITVNMIRPPMEM